MAAMAERLREDPGSLGLVSGVGMHMTKHVYGLWSTEPGAVPVPDRDGVAQELADPAARSHWSTRRRRRRPRVATYSVLHGRDGAPSGGRSCATSPTGRAATPGWRSPRRRRRPGRPIGHPGPGPRASTLAGSDPGMTGTGFRPAMGAPPIIARVRTAGPGAGRDRRSVPRGGRV